MSRRVVITGLGAITPIGNNVDDFYAGIKEGRIGLDNISKFDTSNFRVKIAAEVKDFAPENYMDKKAARRMELFSQYAVAAAGQALAQAGIDMELTHGDDPISRRDVAKVFYHVSVLLQGDDVSVFHWAE